MSSARSIIKGCGIHVRDILPNNAAQWDGDYKLNGCLTEQLNRHTLCTIQNGTKLLFWYQSILLLTLIKHSQVMSLAICLVTPFS